jgi:hypothetical protein
MPPVTTNYVYFPSGPHTRQPRSSGGPGGFTLISSQSGEQTLASNTPFQPPLQPESFSIANQSYQWAFVSVNGGTPEGAVSTTYGTSPAAVTVGAAPITVLVVYVPTSGPTGPGSGATIDSFDETVGSLFNDNFVSVAPDPPPGLLTTSGNVEGYVDTTNSETITALTPTSPSGLIFDRWVLLYPQSKASVSGANLQIAGGNSISALAFYKAPPPISAECAACNLDMQTAQQEITSLVLGRPQLTAAKWGALVAKLQGCVLEGCLTSASVNSVIAAYETLKSTSSGPPLPVQKV